jgi:hypothetical protein
MKFYFTILTLLIMPGLSSCKKDKTTLVQARMKIHFVHKVEGEPFEKDQMIYTNAAGNVYEVTEVMYFISDLKLYHNNGAIVEPATWDDIHYIDTKIPSTFTWNLPGDIPDGAYDSITFTFGISEEKNKIGLFTNPPEVNMAWPDLLGGGFHYLMLNGWWLDQNDIRKAYNFHLGIGQIYENNSGQVQDIIGFVQNYFTVRPDGPGFAVEDGMLIEARLNMHIENWFQNPHIYDHNHWGGDIMQKQAAMQMGCENGWDVFTVDYTLHPHHFVLE